MKEAEIDFLIIGGYLAYAEIDFLIIGGYLAYAEIVLIIGACLAWAEIEENEVDSLMSEHYSLIEILLYS